MRVLYFWRRGLKHGQSQHAAQGGVMVAGCFPFARNLILGLGIEAGLRGHLRVFARLRGCLWCALPTFGC